MYQFRYVDDTWIIQQQANKQVVLGHINSIGPAIQLTVEGNQNSGDIPFLDTLITTQLGHSPSLAVYHMPTHTDQYLSGIAIII